MQPNIPLKGLVLLNAGFAKDDDRWNFGPINSAFTRIYWVTRGSAEVIIGNSTHRLREGHFYLIPPFTTHYDRSRGLFEHYYLHVMDHTRVLNDIYEQYDLPFEMKAQDNYCHIFRHLHEQFPSLKLPTNQPDAYDNRQETLASVRRFIDYDTADRIEIVGSILLIVSLFLHQATPHNTVTDDRVKHALWYIDKHIDRQITISQLASNAALGKERFIRLFEQQTGTTPTAYVLHRKITHAQVLLTTSKKPIKEVAAETGFSSDSYFARVFRQHVGMSPSQFISQNQ